MKRILYHGSEKIINEPVFGGGKSYNDYGQGFYCTETPEMAKEWAVGADRDGFVSQYAFEDAGLSILLLNSPEYTILHWLQILLENRTFDSYSLLAKEARDYLSTHFSLPYQDYDVIIGYRADDSYFSFAQDFLNGAITLRQLGTAMRLGKLGEQYVLKSKKAFQRIQFQSYEPVSHEEWYLKKQKRDRNTRNAYFAIERNRREKSDCFVSDLIEEEIKSNDNRLRSSLY